MRQTPDVTPDVRGFVLEEKCRAPVAHGGRLQLSIDLGLELYISSLRKSTDIWTIGSIERARVSFMHPRHATANRHKLAR